MKRKLYSFINVFGLSIGIAFCILIFLFIKNERNFDHFHAKKDRIYRIYEKSFNTQEPGAENLYTYNSFLPPVLKYNIVEDLPEVEKATRFNAGGEQVISHNEKVIRAPITYVDNEFFHMFSFPVVHGDYTKFLTEKHHVVLTPAVAKNIYGDEDPMGKPLDITVNGETETYIVTGIIEEAPANSNIDFKILISQVQRPYYENSMEGWNMFTTPTFVLLHQDTDPAQFKNKLNNLVDKYVPGLKEKRREKYTVPEEIDIFNLEADKLTEVHLNSVVGWQNASDPKYSFILGGIALLILLIACINYISLALTTSASRRIEVGIRKSFGATKSQLFSQFTLESVTLAFISMIIAVGFVALFLPFFNEFTGKEIVISGDDLVQILLFGLALTLIIGIIAGSYPAIFLAAFKPTQVLKSGQSSKLKAAFTKPLVVLQFALSAFLIISSVIMYQQMKFITTKDLGYNQEQIIVIPTNAGWNVEANRMVERFRNGLLNEHDIIDVAGTNSSFGKGSAPEYSFEIEGEQKTAFSFVVDPNYIPTLGITMAEGRNFDSDKVSDSTAVIINEAFVKNMGWENPLGKRLKWQEGYQVIGVVKDYHFLSLEKDIQPLMIVMSKPNIGYLTKILVKIIPDNIPTTIEKLQRHYKEIAPDKPFEYSFLDGDIERQYASYKRWMHIMGFSTAFGILISCFGLFGLAGINAVNRTKEIGIRKVLGAQVLSIFLLLNKQYIWMAVIAFLIAIPLSLFIMQKWLNNFKYSVTISWELIALSMVIGLFIALSAVSYHAIKTALINPADTLKYE